MTYPGRLGAQTLSLQKHFLSFLFSVVLKLKIHPCSNHWFHKACEMAEKTKMKTDKKHYETKRRLSKMTNCLRKCFHSFKYVIDHSNVRFFFLTSLQTCSHSLNKVNLNPSCDSFCANCCIFSIPITSQFSQVYSYKDLLFKYMSFVFFFVLFLFGNVTEVIKKSFT